MKLKELKQLIKEEVERKLSNKIVLESNLLNIENKIGKNRAIKLYEERIKWLQKTN